MPTADLSTVLDLFERGETAEAVPLLEHLARLLPTNVTTHVLLARALEAERDWERALEAWQWAAFLMPNSPIVARGRRRAIRALAAVPGAAPAAPPPHPAPVFQPADEHAAPNTGAVDVGDAEAPAPEAASARAPAAPEPPVEEAPVEEAPVEEAPVGEAPVGEASPGDLDFLDLAGMTPPPRAAAPRRPVPPLSSTRGGPPRGGAASGKATASGAPSGGSDLDAYDDLDRLIEELESARIVPQPDLDALPDPDLDDDIEDMVSETLARIYAAQGQHDEAARVYELLAAQQPGRADEFRAKATAARGRASD